MQRAKPNKKDQVITCQSVTCLHAGVEWRTQTSTGVGVAPMHASQVYLKKKKQKKSTRALKAPFNTNCELSLISHLTNKQPKIYID